MAWRRFHSNSVKRDDNGPNHSRVVQILKSGSWLLTFALGRLENFTFLTGSELWAPFNFHCGEKWNWRLGEEWCWRPKRVLTCMKWSDWDAHNLVVCFNLTWKEFTIYKPWGNGLLLLSGLERKKCTKRPTATKPSPTRTPTDMDMEKYESGNENFELVSWNHKNMYEGGEDRGCIRSSVIEKKWYSFLCDR